MTTLYLPYPDLPTAEARSAQEAQSRGCSGDTLYWWATQLAADAAHGLLLVDSADLSGLTAAEQAQLLTAAQATTAAYLVAPTNPTALS